MNKPKANPVQEMMRVAGRLVALMDRETELLTTHQTQAIGALQEEKNGLAMTYAMLSREIRAEPELLRALSRSLRDELREALKRFDRAARLNAKAIDAARKANERVIHAIVEAATIARAPMGTGYSNSGGRVTPRRPDLATPVSVALNRQF